MVDCKHGFQAMTWNRNASDLSAWLRALDLNLRLISSVASVAVWGRGELGGPYNPAEFQSTKGMVSRWATNDLGSFELTGVTVA